MTSACCRSVVSKLHCVGILTRLPSQKLFINLKVHRSNTLAMSTSQLFTGNKQTELYAKFRPTYSSEVFARIVSYCRETASSLDLALDLGCGSGQSTVPLTKYFKQVIGTDVSRQQIAKTQTDVGNLSFQVGSAEDLTGFKDSSVDLITIAQAFHWVDQDKCFSEVDRVLRPGGSFVVYGYGMWTIAHAQILDHMIYVYSDVLGKYWPEGRAMIEEKYHTVSLPYTGWIRDDDISIDKQVDLDYLVGYIGSWSAFNKYDQGNPGNTLLADTKEKLKSLAGVNDKEMSDFQTTISWPVFLLMGHKPQ